MTYQTILNMPDSMEKYAKLTGALLKLQQHGPLFFKALEEQQRLFKIYGHEYAEKITRR